LSQGRPREAAKVVGTPERREDHHIPHAKQAVFRQGFITGSERSPPAEVPGKNARSRCLFDFAQPDNR
jgi:hypothetical protein